jgi:calreticulin
MFGPDICGSTRRVHVIFNYNGENYLIHHNIPCETDTFTHVYTLVVHPDQTYEVLIDNEEKRSGSLVEDWDFLGPQEIKDPNVSKPEDWVDEATIVDPNAVKPDGWDDIPQFIADPEAEQPEDWDTELDGDWEAPLMPNPDYEGEWTAPIIPNPDYQGPWEHPLIPNPDYAHDSEIYSYKSAGVGIEIWQVKAGSIFDNVLVSNDVAAAKEAAAKIVAARDVEKELSAAADEAERAEREAEMARLEAELEEEEDAEDHVHDEL